MRHIPVEVVREQVTTLLRAWGMSKEDVETTTEVIVETDLRGVDSHGISMLMSYDAEFRKGRLNMRPEFRVVRDAPSTALLDADASMGHAPSVLAINLAVDKALATGVGVVSVVNSHHFGAAGVYASIAARRGVIGLVMTSTRGIMMVPTRAAEPVLGTNPLACSIPALNNPPFELDMATTTVAAGKVKVHKLNHKPIPAGWVVDEHGNYVTDEVEAARYLWESPVGGVTPLGGTPELGSHKGYGLAAMVHILAGTLAGAAFTPVYRNVQGPSDPHNLGHLFLAIDPGAFRETPDFLGDVDEVIDVLHNTPPIHPDQPVLVAGDPERTTKAKRLIEGIPVSDDLLTSLKGVIEKAGVPFLLDK